ncbi:hypothetical protein JOB18_024272 [Solea senegalensis]|uniref:Secreted protein n=1 Tax=Solea senegalensis TaxID=28829 RepID=A0AAV6PRZ2_SOLSE|nr:hypothetical protein JOB18_024272 [Solea senegalensis]
MNGFSLERLVFILFVFIQFCFPTDPLTVRPLMSMWRWPDCCPMLSPHMNLHQRPAILTNGTLPCKSV